MPGYSYFLCICSVVSVGSFCFPTDDDYDYSDYYDEIYNFKIVSNPRMFTVKLGEIVVLPCDVVPFAPFSRTKKWSHGDGVITNESNAMRLVDHDDLEVHVASELEAGNYTCTVSVVYTSENKSITHQIVIVPEASEEKSTSQYGIAETLSEIASAVDTNTSDIVNSNQTKNKEEAETKIFRSGFLGALSVTLDNTFWRYISQRNTAKSSSGVTGICYWTMFLACLALIV
ncbi:hypothetical protein JTB14_024455 [Gonioctena quinquepunctata]|nr:hypothetical protein JTB14_024455 [Gonioctena quinquepunctata]